MDLSPQDRDLMVRTVLGEAADQSPEGQAAVAHVIMNRAQHPDFGGSPSDVVLAKGQFEPWQTRARSLLSIDPKSDQYQRAAAIVDATANGSTPDPTKGATYFLQPDIVRQRRGGTLPDWASGPNVQIGAHQFFYGGKGNPKMVQNKVDVTDKDVADTARLLGIEATAPAAPATVADVTQTGVNNSDIAETMQLLGINAKPKQPQQPDIVVGGHGVPTKITIRPRFQQPPETMSNQLVEGMPVIGPLFNRAVAASNAGLDPAVNAIRQLMSKEPFETAPTFDERYSQNLEDIRKSRAKYASENPVKSIVANLTGGMMALGPLVGMTRGGVLSPAALLGTYGPSLGSKITTGTIGSAGLGATDAALRGENSTAGATIGAIGGAAGPLVGATVQGGTRYVVNNLLPRTGMLRNQNSSTVSRLVEAYNGESPASIAEARTRMGPAGFMGDVNPAFTDIAGGIADTPGPGKQIVREAYQARANAQKGRVDEALTKAMGKSTNVEDFNNFLTETRKKAADPLYKQWRSMEVQPTDELKALMPRLQKAGAFSMADELSGIAGEPINKVYFAHLSDPFERMTKEEYKAFVKDGAAHAPTTQTWDYVKRGLDRRIDQAYRAGDKTLGRELVKLKGEMIDEIGKTNAGKVWNQARTEFAERSALLDQLEAGRDTFLGGRAGLSADELREELKHLKGPELAARVVGARSAADEAMGATLRGDTTLRNKLLADNNRKKMELLLGKKKADDLLQTMEQEKFLGEQHQNVVGGSQTTPKKERVNALLAAPTHPWDMDLTKPATWIPPSWREQFTPHGIANAWRGQGAAQTANQLAPLITAQAGGPDFNQLIRAIRKEAAVRDVRNQAGARAGSALSGLIAGPGSTTARHQYVPAQQ